MFDQLPQIAEQVQNLQQFNPVQQIQQFVPQVTEHLNPSNWLVSLSSQ